MADLYGTVDVAALDFVARAVDGSGNNAHGGQTRDTYDRVTPASYPAEGNGSAWEAPSADGPHAISDKVMSTDAEIPSSFGANELFQFFGQLITHDVANAEGPARGDPGAERVSFTGDAFGSFDRDLFRFVDGVRAPVNLQTSFLDLSQVYGASDALAGLLREEDSGRLVTGPGIVLPKLADLAAAHPEVSSDAIGAILRASGFGAGGAYIGGDSRLNQQSGLTSGQTLFVLNHNWHADRIAALHPDWSPDRVFEMARAMNEAEWQHVVYDEYVAKLVGPDALSRYSGYRASADPSIINEWTTAAFRFGHDEASDDTNLVNENGSLLRNVSLAQNFGESFGGQAITADPSGQSLAAWMRGFMARPTQEIDGKVADGVRTTLFGAAGVDLAAIDIVRGRDHGVGDYNAVRAGLHLPTYASFEEFAADNRLDKATLAALKEAYDEDIGKLDTEVGGLLEKKAEGSQLGETFTILNVMQFERLRDGDADFYLERFKGHPDLIAAIKATSLADIIARDTGVQYVYHDAFAVADRLGGGEGADEILGDARKGELILGFGGDDTLRGKGGDDDVWGGAGNDLLFGGKGDDRVEGEAGDDDLRGRAGNDRLSGGAGDDMLRGNGGIDTFRFVGGGDDRIADFGRSELIDLSEYAEFRTFADVRARMTEVGHDTVIALTDGSITVDHVGADQFAAGNFRYSHILDLTS